MPTKLALTGHETQWILHLVVDGLGSEHSRRAYENALIGFFAWHAEQGRPPLRPGIEAGGSRAGTPAAWAAPRAPLSRPGSPPLARSGPPNRSTRSPRPRPRPHPCPPSSPPTAPPEAPAPSP